MQYKCFFMMCLLTLSLVVPEWCAGQPPGGPLHRSGLLIGPNFRLYPSALAQSEPFVFRHPTNPNILFASANTINLATGFVSEGVYVTTNGGGTWTGSDTCKGAPITFHRGDPAIAIDTDGRFTLVRLGSSPGLYAHVSTDNGINWSSQRTIALDDQGRGALASDGLPSSPFRGRTYAAWIRFAPPYPVWFSFTTNGGNTWSLPGPINAPMQRGQGGDIAVGPGGSLNACWAGVIGTSPFTEDIVGYARSTDGGALWAVREPAFDMNGIAGLFATKANIRVNGLPRIAVDNSNGSRSGWMYIVTTERNLAPAGTDPDIVLHRSTDNGETWSGGIRVNQDALNNGKYQYFPAICVDDGGGVNVLYYDDRGTTSDSAGVVLSRTTDGGTSWSDYQIGDRNFKPFPIGGLGQGYQGDNIALTSVGDTLWPVWMDNRTGTYQLWASVVRISDLGTGVEEQSVPSRRGLLQNYPNPFNGETNIRYRVPDPGSHVSLVVYDLLGRVVATLVNGTQNAGSQTVPFNARDLRSGVYYCVLRTGADIQTRAMMLLR